MLCNSISNNNKHISSSKDIGGTPNSSRCSNSTKAPTDASMPANATFPQFTYSNFTATQFARRYPGYPG